MILDIVFALLVILGFMKGFNDGIIKSVFTLVSYIVGFFAALHFSLHLSIFLKQSTNISEKFLPFISFVAIFILVLLMIKLLVFLLEKILKGIHLNFINKLAGAIVWCLIVSMVVGSALWLVERNDIVNENQFSGSIVYPYISDVGQFVINNVTEVVPLIKDTISDLDDFMKSSSKRLD